MRREIAERFALGIEWRGDDYGARKQYYVDCFEAGWKSAIELILTEIPMADGAREKLRKIRDGIPYDPVPKMREFTPEIPGN
jgi:hypothetical protein